MLGRVNALGDLLALADISLGGLTAGAAVAYTEQRGCHDITFTDCLSGMPLMF